MTDSPSNKSVEENAMEQWEDNGNEDEDVKHLYPIQNMDILYDGESADEDSMQNPADLVETEMGDESQECEGVMIDADVTAEVFNENSSSNRELQTETYIGDFIYSNDDGSNSNIEEAREDGKSGTPLGRFPTITKAVEAAEYEILQVLYQLLYQRSAWDTQEILCQRILEFSGFNFSQSSEEYFNREMLLQTQPNDVLVKLTVLLGLDTEQNCQVDVNKSRPGFVRCIMSFLSKPSKKTRKRVPSGDNSWKLLPPRATCGCRSNCFRKISKERRQIILDYVKDLTEKRLLDSYLVNMIKLTKIVRKPEDRENLKRLRDFLYSYCVRYDTREITVCKGAFTSIYNLTQSKMIQLQNKIKSGKNLPKKMDLNDFPPMPLYEPHESEKMPRQKKYKRISDRQSWSEESMAAAIEEILNGTIGFKKASVSYNVPQTTLEDRVKKARKNDLSPQIAAQKGLGRFKPMFNSDQEKEVKVKKRKKIKYKRITDRQSWSEESMTAAIQEMLKGTMGSKKASIFYNVPQTTLEDRVKKARKNDLSPQIAAQKGLGRFKPIFNFDQEKELVAYILLLEERLFGIKQTNLRELAFQLAENNDIAHNFNKAKKMAGKEWLNSFLARHPELRLQNPEQTSLAQTKGFKRSAVKKFFTLLQSTYDKYNFSPCDIYNVGETVILTVPNKPSKVLTLREKKQVGLSSARQGVLVTVEACMNAAGNFMPPMFVFPRAEANPHLIEGAPPGSFAAYNESGCINMETFLVWFKRFVEISNPSKDKPVLLLLDGHASHTKSIQLINAARENNVIVIGFPPYTTHLLQPFDVSFMAPLSFYYEQEVKKWLINHPSQSVSIYKIGKLFGYAYLRAAVAPTAIKGFEKTGIYPFNEDVFPDHLFAPAETTERAMEVEENPMDGLQTFPEQDSDADFPV